MNTCGAVLNYCSSYFFPQNEENQKNVTNEVTIDDAALLLLIASQDMTNNVVSPGPEPLMAVPADLPSQPDAADTAKPQQEKPFVCPKDGCDGAFKRKAHLEMHIRIHTDERPFVCTHKDCGKSFRSKSHLNTHERFY